MMTATSGPDVVRSENAIDGGRFPTSTRYRSGPTLRPVFDHVAIDFDPAGDFEAFLKRAAAKWVVYLLADADDRPVQLLCVKNLRVQPEAPPRAGRRTGGPVASG